MKTRNCLNCDAVAAALVIGQKPGDQVVFCSGSCAATWAVEKAIDEYVWCPRHGWVCMVLSDVKQLGYCRLC